MKAKRQTMAASESCHQATKQLHTETCQMLFGSTQKREAERQRMKVLPEMAPPPSRKKEERAASDYQQSGSH